MHCQGQFLEGPWLCIMPLPTPDKFWKYSGFAIEMHSSADYRSVKGELQKSKKQISVRGLNRDCNHDLKNLFKVQRPSLLLSPVHSRSSTRLCLPKV